MDKKDALAQLRNLLRLEQEYQEKKWFSQGVSLKQLRNEGVVIYPIRVLKKRFGFADYPVFSFSFSHEVTGNFFRGGAPISIFSDSNDEVCTGNLLYLHEQTGEVTLFTADFPEWLDQSKVGIKLMPDSRSFDLMHGVLKQLQKEELPRTSLLFEYLHGVKTLPDQTSENINDWFNTGLNSVQQNAVNHLVANNPIQVLHGPPGTGKTTTLIEATQQLVARGKHVVVTAPSNAAVDHFAQQLIQQGVSVFRLGNTLKVNEKVWEHSAEGILSQQENAKRLKKLRIQADEYRKLAHQYKRNFGKSEREQRQLLKKEAKAIREEIKQIADFLLEKALHQAQVILGTPIGLHDPLLKDTQVDYLIIDEAGQCLEPMAWVPIQLAQNLILAGDPFQLPPTVICPEAEKNGLTISILERAFKSKLPLHLLYLQYRMPPMIANFSSNYFYGGKLNSVKENKEDTQHLLFIDTAGANYSESSQSEGSSRENIQELEFISNQVNRWVIDPEKAVFISPYAAQVRLAKGHLPIKCSTIDAFQGQEADQVIISLVRSNEQGNIGFLTDYRRMNVAMTRAKKQLIVIGDSATLGNDLFYSQFLSYVEEVGAYKSVFEYTWEN